VNKNVQTSLAVFLNFTLCVNQLLADLPPISFEATEWVPYQTVGQGGQPGWELNSGTAETSPMGEGLGGGKALKIPASPVPTNGAAPQESRISRSFPWDIADKTAFIDLQVKPAADPVGSLASFYANGTQIAFQVPSSSTQGEVWVYHGDEGATESAATSTQWIKTVGSFTVAPGATAASDYLRVTLRHDYLRNIWDLFINGKLAAANLAFKGRGANLQGLEFYGSNVGATLIDDLSAQTVNMLFPDADKDGLPDAWEIANGSNPNVYDRDALKPGSTGSFLDAYMSSLWTNGSVNAATAVPTSQGIPPLTIDSDAPHTPVTSLKGSLSVGGDGSAGYSFPIDIPKGSGGMEPKLALGYSSSGGNGMLGVGWNLGGLQRITRGPLSAAKPWNFAADGPKNPANAYLGAAGTPTEGNYDPADFDKNDRFYLDGELLVCVAGTYGEAGSEYRTEIDSYARITAIGSTGQPFAGPISWRIETKAGLIVDLGVTSNSRNVVAQGTLSWGVTKVADTLSNYYTVEYTRDPASAPFQFVNDRISAIRYTGNTEKQIAPYCSVEFQYEERPDKSRSFTKYAGYSSTKRLAKVKVLTGNYVNHSYQLRYTNSYQTGRSLLTSIQKLQQDNPSPFIAPTAFTYDGISASEPLWKDPGESALPVYGNGLDATAEVNSMVSTSEGTTQIDLVGDVSRAFKLPGGGYNLTGTTLLQFEFKSSQLASGAIIGLNLDLVGFENVGRGQLPTGALFRIGGTGSTPLPTELNSVIGTQPYNVTTPALWQTYTLDIGQFVRGNSNSWLLGLRPYLILMNADNENSDGIANASFRNIKIYQTGAAPPQGYNPIVFPTTTELPRFSSSTGQDLGVATLDLNGDGLMDLSDWRVLDYNATSNTLTPNTVGSVFLNTGGKFVNSDALLPPKALPIAFRSSDSYALEYNKKFHFVGQPCDVDGDGNLDFLAAKDITYNYNTRIMKNRYMFYTLGATGWVEKPGWEFPFLFENLSSTTNYGGAARDEHFTLTDINSDGYVDLLIHATAKGKINFDVGSVPFSVAFNGLSYVSDGGIAFINKGKFGPGWIASTEYQLPGALTVGDKDVGRRLVDMDGDTIPEFIESVKVGSFDRRRIFRLSHLINPNYGWNGNCTDPFPTSSTLYGTSFDVSSDFPEPLTYGSAGTDAAGPIMMDVNGDGLVDVVNSATIKNIAFAPKTFLNLGNGANKWAADPLIGSGVFDANNYTIPLILSTVNYDNIKSAVPFGYEFSDINGDGLSDILYSNIESVDTPSADNTAILNTGNGWLERETWRTPASKLIYKSKNDRLAGRRGSKLLDINGDGFPDLITDLLGTTPRVWFNNCRPEVLKSVVDGFGSVLQVNYTRLNDPVPPADGFGSRVYQKWTDTMPAGQVAVIDSRLVVSSYSEPDGLGGTGRRIRAQRYGDLRYDRYNESSLGFGWIEAKDLLNNQTTRTETMREYPFGGSPKWTRTWVQIKSSDVIPALVGVSAGTRCLSEETATYGELPSHVGIGSTIRRPIQTGSVKSLYNLNETLVSRTTTVQSSFDAYGFVLNSTVTALDGSTVTTANTYDNSPTTLAKWYLGRLMSSTVTKAHGDVSSSKSSAFTYVPATGLLKSETIEPGNALSVTKTYSHDGFGNITNTTVTGSGITRSGSSVYDPTGRFLIGESNQLGHTISYSYDFNRAILLSTSDIARKTTRFGYDALGTLIRTYHPDSTQTGESTNYYTGTQNTQNILPTAVSAFVTNPIFYVRAKQTSGAPTAKVYLDQSGRDVVSETTILRDANASSPGTRYSQVFTVTQYDSLGRKTKVSDAFGASEVPKFTQIFYDVVSRVHKTINPDGSVDEVTEFSTDTLAGQPVSCSIAKNSKTGILKRWEDQHGRFVKSQDPSTQITTFHHDLEGRLTSVKIDEVPMLTNTFDTFGNKTSVTEANSGTSSSTFNAFGEVLTSTNAKNQVTSFTYDAMGRPLTVDKPEGLFTTYYDGATGSGLGKPWKTIGPAGYQELISYDDMGRPRSSSKTQFGETFTSSTTYDALSRVVSETDAGGLTVIHAYDPLYSFPTKLSIGLGSPGAGTVLWQAGTFDAKGRPLTQTLAQGVSTSASYHPLSGLLTGLNASAGGTPLQAKTYEWDSLGNLITRTDDLMKRSETFGYDIQNRVTSTAFASLPGATTTTLPPPDAYTYATNGNLLTKGQATLKYEGTRPHAVSSAVIKGASRTYSYDAAGYVTSDSKRTYTWTSFGQLLSLDYLAAPALQNFAGGQIFAASRVQTDFSFDAGGNRARQLKQRLNSDTSSLVEETTYLGSYEREVHSTKSAPAAPMVLTRTVHRHSIGGFAVYTRTDKPGLPSETKLTTILKDHLGSTDLLYTGTWTGTWTGSSFSTPTPASIERQSFDPWGERRAPDTLVSYRATDTDTFRSSAQDYDRGYTGHEQLDDSGLIHMNGRIYDPELGRMLSPDPFVQVPEYSQNFNRYSYVMNNPLNLTDPSGFSWLSKAFKKIGNWFSENWRTVVVIVVAAFLVLSGIGAALFAGLWGALGGGTVVAGSYLSIIGTGAVVGAITGGLGAALAGGSLGDVLRGAVIGGISGALTGALHGVGGTPLLDGLNVAGHGVVGGTTNVAMGGKFQDGFLSAAASAATAMTGLTSTDTGTYGGDHLNLGSRTIIASVAGGTASALGGGKFANGALTGAMTHLLNAEAGPKLQKALLIGKDQSVDARNGDKTYLEPGEKLRDPILEDIEDAAKIGGYKLFYNATKDTISQVWGSRQYDEIIYYNHGTESGNLQYNKPNDAKSYFDSIRNIFNPSAGTAKNLTIICCHYPKVVDTNISFYRENGVNLTAMRYPLVNGKVERPTAMQNLPGYLKR
jgi:RHS repeat-associated protein